MLKALEPLKKTGLKDEEMTVLIQKAYYYYKYQVLPELSDGEKNYSAQISALVRFFKSVNYQKISDPTFFNNALKKEIFNNKPNSLQEVQNNINEIMTVEKTKLIFSSADNNHLNLTNIIDKNESKGQSIKKIVNFDYKVNVVMSNNYSNRLLTPEIYMIFTLDDGSVLKMKTDVRMFNEFRKNLSLNIKKIIDNEDVPLLK